VRINTLKAKKTTLKEIKALGVELSPISWCKDAYIVTTGYSELSKSDLFTSGAFILQDPASFVPVLALDPKSGEYILDICAAPGGKTTHIAALSKNKAHIVANDTSRIRFFKMRDIFNTYGVRADTTLYDGRFLRKHLGTQQYDKILLDAPCSGEAAINPANPKTYEQWSTAKIKRLSRLQEQLIMIAYDLLKPGGTLVYSTCTIAPEENELVIDYLLKRRSAQVQQIDIPVEGAKPGLTSWHGKSLNPTLTKAYRILPTDTHEAFFTAKISKPLGEIADDEDVYYA
jgi:16S rRNA (cytosine1407-C5)-methyltransferase